MKHYDVIVAGGGPAGIAAAIAAARNSCEVLLIEKEAYLGGMATSASVPAFGPYTDGRTPLIGGIGREVIEELKKKSYVSPFFDFKEDRIKQMDWYPIDSEQLKEVLDRMVVESGCNLLLHSTVIGVECEEGTVKQIQVYSKSGIRTLEADFYIDCTGDADLATMAGAEYEYGDEQGNVQAGTLCFKIANFDTERFMEYAKEVGENGNLTVAVQRAKENGEFPAYEQKVCGIALYANGMAGFNFGHVYNLEPLDEEKMSAAEIEGRKKLPELMQFIKKYVPGAENAVLAGSGPNIGVRESRRIMGEYYLTKDDYYARADFEDAIAYYNYPIDIHPSLAVQSGTTESLYKNSKYKAGEAYAIPYRCLTPKKLNNVLIAGRCISCDRAMMATVRMMPPCFATGEAAGTAAALCKIKDKEIKKLDVMELKKELIKNGTILR